MQPMVLAFNVSDDRLGKLRFACMSQGVQVKGVTAEDFAQPIGALCGLLPREEAPEVATPTNIHWQAPQLYRELSAEREAIANHQKPAHQEEPSC